MRSGVAGHRDEPVVLLPPLSSLFFSRFDHSDGATLEHAAGDYGRVHQDQDVQRIAIIAQRRWNKAEVEGKGHPFGERGGKFKTIAVWIIAVFVAAPFGRFDHCAQIPTFLIVGGGVGQNGVTGGVLWHG